MIFRSTPQVVSFAFSGGLAIFAAAIVAHAYAANAPPGAGAKPSSSGELDEARAQLDRAKTFLASEPQIFVAWTGARRRARHSFVVARS